MSNGQHDPIGTEDHLLVAVNPDQVPGIGSRWFENRLGGSRMHGLRGQLLTTMPRSGIVEWGIDYAQMRVTTSYLARHIHRTFALLAQFTDHFGGTAHKYVMWLMAVFSVCWIPDLHWSCN
ncbi:hypothetical protein [Escherichia coli]|uniref:hypothetical protein n=1 Tax=Escherichia coli TaxID=562 RepID=UPI0024AE1EFF|nr:hypothetical protein [Escherichia coli]WHI44297.1 hypothetical protein QDY30_27140 [Escherichia coli]